jgi:hypothetical protein
MKNGSSRRRFMFKVSRSYRELGRSAKDIQVLDLRKVEREKSKVENEADAKRVETRNQSLRHVYASSDFRPPLSDPLSPVSTFSFLPSTFPEALDSLS